MILSAAILEEMARALNYPRIQKCIQMTSRECLEFLEGLAEVSEMVEGVLTVDAVKADPDDNKYVACAIEGNASVLVSGDHHLLGLKTFQQIRIISPRQFLTEMF